MNGFNSRRRGFVRMIEALEPRRLLVAMYPDPAFGELGTAAFPTGLRISTAVVIQPLGGGRTLVAGEIDTQAALLRILSDGSLDTTFGNNGMAIAPEVERISTGIVQDDGKVVLVGHAFEVVRFNADGSLDSSFGLNGSINPDFIPFKTSRTVAVAMDGDDRIIIVGDVDVSGPGDRMIAIARLLGDGTLDTSFSGDGIQTLDTFEWGTSVAIQADGRILIGGYTFDSGEEEAEAVVYRLLDDGSLDTSFDGDGERVVNFGGFQNRITSLLVEPGGTILVGGQISGPFSSDRKCVIARLGADGALDTAFASDGMYFFGEDVVETQALGLDSGGNIVAIGVGVYDGFFVRLDSDGAPDTTLGNGLGALALDLPVVHCMSLVDDNTILIGGRDFSVTRLVPRPDENFVDGAMFLTGGDGNDTLSLEIDGTDVDVTWNGVTTTIALADLELIDLELHGGADEVTIDLLLEAALRADLGEGENSLSAGDLLDTTVRSGSGGDTLDIGSVGDDDADSNDNVVQTGGGNDTIAYGAGHSSFLLNAGDGDDTISTIGSEMNLRGGAGNDSITAGDGPQTLSGEAGDDTLIGGSGNQTFIGDDGDDSIICGSGSDTIDGGEGNDSLDAGPGDDVVTTGDGLNTVHGGDGDDTILGGVDADSFLGGDGNDSLGAGNGANTIFAGAGNDILRGGDDNDWYWGESGYDTLKGGLGGDFLHGGNGKDKIFGQEGNDRLYGSGNDDALDGGAGNDLLVAGDRNDKLWADDDETDTVDGGAGDDQSDLDNLLDGVQNVETLL